MVSVDVKHHVYLLNCKAIRKGTGFTTSGLYNNYVYKLYIYKSGPVFSVLLYLVFDRIFCIY